MPKYIDVGAINWYDDLFMKGINNSGVWVRYKDVESLIRNAPAADVEPVRHGRWVRHGEGYDCSECKKWVDGDIHYSFEDRTPLLPVCCPFCGAKMDGEPPKEE